jgi:PAS domain S-box-containing protein
MTDLPPRDAAIGRLAALEADNARLRKALEDIAGIQANAAAVLLGLNADVHAGPSHEDVRGESVALASARAETRKGRANLRASEAALASSRAEARVRQADLLASEVALAASQVETKVGLAELLVSAVDLAVSRAENKVSVKDLLASAIALSLSKAETTRLTEDLHDRDGQITSITKDQEWLRNVVEASPTALILMGPEGQIAMVNVKAERLFGYSRSELHGQKLEVLLPERFRVGHLQLRNQFMTNISSRSMGEGRKLFGLRQDGTQFPLEIGLNPIDLGGERLVLAGVTDITMRLAAEDATLRRQQVLERSNGELIRARLRAEQATRAKSLFLAGMSHELRTPLNGILGYAQLLDIEGGLTDLQAARVAAMRSAGEHLLKMITSVLDLSEVEAGHITLQVSSTDLRHLIQDCLDVIRPSIDARGLTLRLKIARDVPETLVVDSTRLRQVLLNLLANAVKFTDQGSVELRLSVSPGIAGERTLLIEIVDTGRGIPSDRRASLFKDFERLGAGADGGVEGAGLGLAISAHLVGLMGGRIVHTNNVGGGSVFSFELTMNALTGGGVAAETYRPPEDAPDHSGSVPLGDAGSGLLVLVVDDIAMNRDIAASFLRAAGHDVVCVDGGAAAIAAVAQRDFDFVLMDLRMPEIDGFQAAAGIRAIGGKRGRVPIIALTAHAFADHIEECRRAGMVGHVSKPFTQESLLAALHQAKQASNGGLPALEVASVDVSALPIMDVDCFESTMAFLAPGTAALHLQAIAASMEKVLLNLRARQESEAVSNALADAVHALTGTVGIVGFVRVSDTGRRFERAARTGVRVAPALTADLVASLDASLREVRVRMHHALDTVAALGSAHNLVENASVHS